MTSNTITINGRLAADPILRFTSAAVAVLNCRIGHTPRKKVNNEWVDGETVWLDVDIWRDGAERFAEVNATKGDEVLVTGQLTSRTWSKDGQDRTSYGISAEYLLLARKKGQGGTSRPAASAPADQWASASVNEGEPPW